MRVMPIVTARPAVPTPPASRAAASAPYRFAVSSSPTSETVTMSPSTSTAVAPAPGVAGPSIVPIDGGAATATTAAVPRTAAIARSAARCATRRRERARRGDDDSTVLQARSQRRDARGSGYRRAIVDQGTDAGADAAESRRRRRDAETVPDVEPSRARDGVEQRSQHRAFSASGTGREAPRRRHRALPVPVRPLAHAPRDPRRLGVARTGHRDRRRGRRRRPR